MYFLQFTWLFD